MKSKILSFISKNWKKNKDKDYPQTWYYMPKKYRRIRVFLQWFCGICGGHELSNTEWGYGGGEYADRWCRWCDKKIQVPKESIRFSFKDSEIGVKDLMDEVEPIKECEGKCKL